jgi:hypothetical protein
MKSIREIITKTLGLSLNEMTTTSNAGGTYKPPLRPGLRKWFKKDLKPYTEITSEYIDAELNYDTLDGHTKKSKKEIKKKENHAKYIRDTDYEIDSKDEGDDEYAKTPFVSEADSSITSGMYNGPLEIGLKKWRKQELNPFTKLSKHNVNKARKQKTLKNNTKRVVGVWEKHHEDGYEIPTHDAHTINEDLAVWFGTKKKPKGSKQPKGPWVNICKKVDGKHPPCGRPDASDRAYPKCRAAGVAGKMSDSQKKAACAQKRRAEKTNPKVGTGNKPKMVSYKPRKKNTNEEQLIKRLINKLK